MAEPEPLAVAPVSVQAVALTILGGAATIFALRTAAPAVVPLLVSILLAYALEPAVLRLIRWGVPRVLAAIIVYLLLAMAFGSAARTIRTQVDAFVADLPNRLASMQQITAALEDHANGDGLLARIETALRDVQEAARRPPPPGVRRVMLVPRAFRLRDYVLDAGIGAAAIGAKLFAIALLTFLMLATGDLYKKKILDVLGPRSSDRKITLQVITNIDKLIERYLLVRVLISGIVAVATGTGLALVGVAHAAVWGAIAGVLNVVPLIGPSAAVVLITIAAFLQFKTLEMTAAACGVSALVAALEGNLISPWLTSRAGELNIVAVFVSVLFWGWMWDVWGLLLAVPIMVVVKAAADHIEQLKPLGELLGR